MISILIKNYELVSDKIDETFLFDIWMWISILEFIVIIVLVSISIKKTNFNRKRHLKNKSLSQEVDFDNIINSSFNSNELYNILKVKCHPDRFVKNKSQNDIANRIFQEISKNKTNLKRLQDLKFEASKLLNINF